jgi:hypothetical protein
MRYREIGDIFIRKGNVLFVVEGDNCYDCQFDKFAMLDSCVDKHKCDFDVRYDRRSVYYKNVTSLLVGADSLLIERGLLNVLSQESIDNIKALA